MTADAAGFDVHAAIAAPVTLRPGARALIALGFSLELPRGFEAQVRPRSGLALKYGVTCLNSPGTIDADYRGEVSVLLINHGAEDFTVTRGMRVAQLIVQSLAQVRLEVVEALTETARAARGFGSTGM